MSDNGDWVRVRGIGRERFAGYVAEYLGSLGFSVERNDSTELKESWVTAHLTRMNPAVPPSATDLKFRLYPTSGGAALVWVAPQGVAADDRPRMDRLVREMLTHLERTVATESHATAKLSRIPTASLPWERDASGSNPPRPQ